MNTIRRLFLLVAIVFYGNTLLPQSSGYQKLSLIMTDLETGETFVNKNGDQLLTPASITKLITTATAIYLCVSERIERYFLSIPCISFSYSVSQYRTELIKLSKKYFIILLAIT